MLSKLDKVLAQVRGSGKTFVLADYFDYIGGSETGAIIAAGLARGCPVAELTEFFTHANNQTTISEYPCGR